MLLAATRLFIRELNHGYFLFRQSSVQTCSDLMLNGVFLKA